MKTIYVVKRPFKSAGKYYAVGTILEDLTGVKLPKIKVREGKLVPFYKGAPRYEDNLKYLEHCSGKELRQAIREALSEKPKSEPKPASKPKPQPAPKAKPAAKKATPGK